MDRRETVILHVVRAAFLVKQHVPVGPAHCAVVEIIDHGLAVNFAPLPVVDLGEVKRSRCSLR